MSDSLTYHLPFLRYTHTHTQHKFTQMQAGMHTQTRGCNGCEDANHEKESDFVFRFHARQERWKPTVGKILTLPQPLSPTLASEKGKASACVCGLPIRKMDDAHGEHAHEH